MTAAVGFFAPQGIPREWDNELNEISSDCLRFTGTLPPSQAIQYERFVTQAVKKTRDLLTAMENSDSGTRSSNPDFAYRYKHDRVVDLRKSCVQERIRLREEEQKNRDRIIKSIQESTLPF